MWMLYGYFVSRLPDNANPAFATFYIVNDDKNGLADSLVANLVYLVHQSDEE
jgi:hypothetical protein